MKVRFHEHGWEDYLWWQVNDRTMLRKINRMIEEASRDPQAGTGKPERLRYFGEGFWSRRITQEHRMVYTIVDGELTIVQMRGHY